MIGIVDWAAARARMVIAFIMLSIMAGTVAYVGLPKEGEPDIEVPALFVSVPFPGISAADSESLLVKPMETELADLDKLKKMTATASENYAGIALEFEFGWDKTRVMADVRDKMNKAEAQFPAGAEKYSINEINFSEFPIIIVNLTGDVPERTMSRVANDLKDRLESIDAVLEAGIAGQRDEMLEVVIDPLRLEAYNVTAGELISVVRNNNQLIAAGEIETNQGAFSVKIPSSFDEPRDVYELPVKTNGDRVITLGDLAQINLTFEDRLGTARFNGKNTVALQIVKRKGFNLLDTTAEVRRVVEDAQSAWPAELKAAVEVGTSNDQSRVVGSMVSQLEGSVLTAIALVMIVVLASLGTRAALLVGFAIPTSFLLCFAFLAVMGVTISNIVMFGLILAVGMLVDGAIVVVEYADKRIEEGSGPMRAYVEAAKRMFWPVVSSTATTLCAFLPMLFWPGVAGEFMGMLPVTLIFVLSASLVVALVYLPVMGGVAGRMSRRFGYLSDTLRRHLPRWLRIALVPVVLYLMFVSALMTINPGYLSGAPRTGNVSDSFFGAFLFMIFAFAASIIMNAAGNGEAKRSKIDATYRRTAFGRVIYFIAGNPIMPIVTLVSVAVMVVLVFSLYGKNNKGVEFFVESEPEQAIVYVKARGNFSLAEKDALIAKAEEIILRHPGIDNAFAFAGKGGLNANTSGAQPPKDSIGQIQLELVPWEDRQGDEALDGNKVMAELKRDLDQMPGVQVEILEQARGPAAMKPLHLRIKSDDLEMLNQTVGTVRAYMDQLAGLTLVEDSRPLPGIDWRIDVDVEKAGRYGADVATVGAMVQLVTRGILLDTMRVESSDKEIEIRVRLPEKDRLLSTLDTLKVRTRDGLVPLSNFITRTPVPKLAEINRVGQKRYFDIKAGVTENTVSILADPELIGQTGEDNVEIAVLQETEGTADITREISGGLFGSDETKSYSILSLTDGMTAQKLQNLIAEDADLIYAVVDGNERIKAVTKWLEANPTPTGVSWEWTGDLVEQQESQAFLGQAFLGALGLMFIILLAQFNSFYNSVLVLLAVILSTTGVLIGMMAMDQSFSIIMTGTGIVALAGIVVNNNIVLIDTYQEFSQYMPRIEAVTRTAEARIRPVLLTTITTMAGLMPMMFGLSLDFLNGGYSIDSPTALWWKQLASAVVWGLGVATVLTLVVTPALLSLRIWLTTYLIWGARLLAKMSLGNASRVAHDLALSRMARKVKAPEILWPDESEPQKTLKAAE